MVTHGKSVNNAFFGKYTVVIQMEEACNLASPIYIATELLALFSDIAFQGESKCEAAQFVETAKFIGKSVWCVY